MKILSVTFFLMLTLSVLIKAETLKTGDLIFQVEDKGEFSKAISSATSTGDSLTFVHVGIIQVEDQGITNVIEASPHQGVCITSLDDFICAAPVINGKPGIVIKRLKISFPIKETIERAKKHLGEGYDWWYLPDNGKMYCSELIYESYRQVDGKPLFNAKPMNFRNPDGTLPDFWIRLFAKLGKEVPEGVLGTNPQDISKEVFLEDISYF